MAAVEWNLAAMTKWEELTGRPFSELQEIAADFGKAKITDIANMLICGMYGAQYPDADLEAIRKQVFALKPGELENFFSALQPDGAADQ